MSQARALAARLRQAVQGCTTHLHGPVQAHAAVQAAVESGEVQLCDVSACVEGACRRRIAELRAQGAEDDDPRVVKEERTVRFVSALLGEGGAEASQERTEIMRATDHAAHLEDAVAPHIDLVRAHPMYSRMRTLDHVRLFMQHHVFAVWDFMCLLKALQRAATCVEVPWVPSADRETRRLINETVLDEESDVDPSGGHVSHFEMYLAAMREVGADTGPVEQFVDLVRGKHLIHVALKKAGAPKAAQDFVVNTLDIINVGKPHAVCAAFTVGREQAIPSMFAVMIRELHQQFPDQLGTLQHYLARHVEVDGEKHGPLARRMLANFCGDDPGKWFEVTGTAIVSLQARKRLWDAVAEQLG